MGATEGTDSSMFRDISADDDDHRPVEMESYCTNCGDNEHGTEIVLQVKDEADLNRQVVKSEYARIEIPELELVIEPRTQAGEVTTVEGVVNRVKRGLEQDQERRSKDAPEVADQVNQFIKRLDRLTSSQDKFTLRLKDASGNCYIQNPDPLHVDPHCITTHYQRSLDEKKMLALADDDEQETEPAPEWQSFEDAKHEVLRFPTECSHCGAQTETCMKPTDVPFFSTVIIMSTACDACGLRTNEVKSGGAIQDHGCKLNVSIEQEIDLARDVLKSDTCSMSIPELDLEVGPGALSGRFTTVEGLLTATREQLKEQGSFLLGDSAVSESKGKMSDFLDRFESILSLKTKVHLVLDDPAGNSYIQSLTAPLDDPRLDKTFYERNFDQNEELGLNDMKVENYGELETLEEGDETEQMNGDDRGREDDQ